MKFEDIMILTEEELENVAGGKNVTDRKAVILEPGDPFPDLNY